MVSVRGRAPRYRWCVWKDLKYFTASLESMCGMVEGVPSSFKWVPECPPIEQAYMVYWSRVPPPSVYLPPSVYGMYDGDDADNCTSYTLCLPLSPCLCLLPAGVPRLCNDAIPAADKHDATSQAPAAVPARTHALHVHTIAYTFHSRAWSLRGAGLALHHPF